MAKKELCFVIMPFHEDFLPTWKIIQRVSKEFKYLNVERSTNQDPGKKKIFQNIQESIKRASFVIVDISLDPKYKNNHNPNVMLEAGYAMGMGKDLYFIHRKPMATIPSDLSQHSIMDYDPQNKELDKWFEIRIEKMMIAHGIETDRVVLKRETQSQKLNWLIDVVQQLRSKARENYEHENWTIGPAIFSADGYTFSMKYTIESPSENGIQKYELKCGVFFSQWKRRETPFRIEVRKIGKTNSEDSSHELNFSESIESIPVEKILDQFEEKLDQILLELTPNISTLTPLASILQTMDEVRDDLASLQLEGFKTKKDRLKKIGEDSGHKKYTRISWARDGFAVPGFIVNSTVDFWVDFNMWEEFTQDTPYWICFSPFDERDSDKVKGWFSKIEVEEDGPVSLIPVVVQNKADREEIIGEYRNILKTLVKKCQPHSPVVSEE